MAWAGDARAVLVRGGTVARLTRDHNLARALVEAGTISEAEAAGLRGGFRLWLYLGRSATEFRSDATAFDPRPGDRLVLATDGAANLLDDAALCAIVAAAPDPTSCAEAVVELAVATGSRDNCTCAVLAFDAYGDAPAERPLPEPQGPAHAPRRWWQFWK